MNSIVHEINTMHYNICYHPKHIHDLGVGVSFAGTPSSQTLAIS